MSNSYGSLSRGNSARRRRKRRDDMIRAILSIVLVCVLLLVVGFLGIKALKNDQSDRETQDNHSSTSADEETTTGVDQTTEQTTEEPTEATTEEPTEAGPVMVEKPYIVWIDAGHGGSDWGSAEWVRDENGNWLDANGNIVPEASDQGAWIVREKHDNLDLALAVQKALETRGVTVKMTRTEDAYVHNIDERVPRANESGAECFVSLHRNYMKGNDQEKGIEIWGVNWDLYNNNPEKAKDQQLAEMIRDELKEEQINGFRGIYRNTVSSDDYSVLWRTKMPSIIIEMGFMSNKSDNELFRSEQEAYAAAIADGIVTWLNSLN
ncbi:MAG: N-acetylmuramoyl-L-alanine amidase [Ruminococcaceae bacterium]|nr:N-acetylmuramoyl-L-alanine amidase [Oscillospiraceae bacterium]